MAVTGSVLGIAALAGLMGAPHCLIMCGGIVSSVALHAHGNPLPAVLAYNAGRVATYTAVGCAMGWAGSFLNMAGGYVGLQGAASIIGGLLILAWAFRRYTLPIYRAHPAGHRWVQSALGRLGRRSEPMATFLTGMMLGFLPCGLTYAMQMNAAASGSAAAGAMIMLVFGLATFPILFLTALTAGSLSRKWRKGMRRAGAYLAVLMGSLAIMKGLSANGLVPGIHPWLW